MLTYERLIKEKMLDDYGYQREFLENPDFYEPTKPVLLAVGTGGGKTYMTIMKLDIYYSNPENKGKKTVVFPHATNVIRSNFEKSILKYGDVNFKHCVIEDSSQIEEVFNSDCEVIVVLPQTLMNHLDKVSKVDWLVVDEAHEWYGQESYTKILNALDPEYQLLLTGTPSKFNRRDDEFYYHHISVNKLREVGKLGNARVHIVSSNYKIDNKDIGTNTGNIRHGVVKASQTESSLYKVCKSMLKTLNKGDIVEGDNIADTLFNTLNKTIIFCRTQAQAKRFYNVLNEKLNGKVLKSLSEDGGNSSEFETFAEDDSIKVLILVRKGRLGFDMPNLYNIVDFTLTTNVDNIMQMLGRILRTDENKSLKYYYKVSPENSVPYYQAIMMVVLRLTMQDAFVVYNGLQNEVVIPKMDDAEQPEPDVDADTDVDADVDEDWDNLDVDEDWDNLDIDDSPKEPTEPVFKDISPDLIMDLDFFSVLKERSGGDEFAIVSSCTLDDVRRECFGLRERKTVTYEECVQIVKERGYTRKIEFQYGAVSHYSFIQTRGLMKQFVKDTGLKGRKLALTKEEVKACADECSSRIDFHKRFQSKYKKAKSMGWLDEWFGEPKKSGPKEGQPHPGRGGTNNNFTLKTK